MTGAGRGQNPMSAAIVKDQPPNEAAVRALASAGRKIATNFGSLLVGRFGSQLIGFVTNAYLARRIAPGGFGAVSIAQAVMTYLTIFSDAGLATIAEREASQRPEELQDLIGSISGLRFVLATACTVAGLLCAQLLPYPESSRAIFRIFALSLPVGALSVDWVFRGIQRMHYSAILQIVGAAVALLLTVCFVRTSGDVLRFPVIMLVVGMITLALGFQFLRRAGYRFRLSFVPRLFARHLSESLPLCASWFAVTFYVQMNYLILGKLRGEADVGFYSAAHRLGSTLFSLTSLYYVAMAPTLMATLAQSREAAARLFRGTVRLTATIGFGLIAIGSSASALLVSLTFGSQFAAAAPVLRVMVFSLGVLAVSGNWGRLALADRRERLILESTVAGAVANVVLCSLLARPLGAVGAALGNLAAECTVAFVQCTACSGEFRAPALRETRGPALSLIAALIASRVSAPLGVVAATVSCGLVYVTGLLVTGAVTSRDVQRLRLMLRE